MQGQKDGWLENSLWLLLEDGWTAVLKGGQMIPSRYGKG